MIDTKKCIEVMREFINGEKIELSIRNSNAWTDCLDVPNWDWVHYDYRVKPRPREVWIAESDLKKYAKTAYIEEPAFRAIKFVEVTDE